MQMNAILDRLGISDDEMDQFVYLIRDDMIECNVSSHKYWYSEFVYMELRGYNNIYFLKRFFFKANRDSESPFVDREEEFTLDETRLLWMYCKQIIRKENGLKPYDCDEASLMDWPADPYLNIEMFSQYFDQYPLDYFLDKQNIDQHVKEIAKIIIKKNHPIIEYDRETNRYNASILINPRYNPYELLHANIAFEFLLGCEPILIA